MAEISKFFNSAPGDPRTYQASDFADYFGSVLSTGLLHTDNIPALEVKCDGNDLRTYVTPGKAIIQGYLYENTSNLYLEHALPEATYDRIDRIVLRLDKRNQSRFIRAFVKQGEPSANPVPPALQRDDFIYELSLAQIRVRANTSTLNPADLIDERLDENLCGLVHSLISIPTSQFQQQWNLYFNAKKNEIDAETLNYQQQLASDIAAFEQEWDTWFSGIQNSSYETPAGAQAKANQAEANAKAYLDNQKGQVNGVATLGPDGKVPAAQLNVSTTANAITITDSSGYYTGTDVEAALQEIGQTLNAMRGDLITSVNNVLNM